LKAVAEACCCAQYLPVSVSLQSGFGCDFVLFDLVAALADAGIVATSVQTGTSKTFAQ
jgi:2-methylisocitrate lyase-like PEP mutase family enzyme